jgi:sugar/nucleoside kinase (ribokinase family)
METADLDVFVVGGTGIDIVVRVPSLPLPVRADSIMVPPIDRYVGHTGTGVALGCQALGLRTALVDVIGDDEEGRSVRDACERAGLDFGWQTHPSGTRRAVNLVDPAGRRLSLYDARQPADLVADTALYQDRIARARHVHVSIVGWALPALAAAVAAGRSTSTDLHDWDGVNDYHREFAYSADIVFVSAAELGDRVDALLTDILRRGRAKVAVAMDGARGSRLAVPGAPVTAVPAVQLAGRPVVDSNGAGDSYVAAFLWAVLGGDPGRPDWARAAAAGSVGGAYACGTAGTHTSFVDVTRLAAELGPAAAAVGSASHAQGTP